MKTKVRSTRLIVDELNTKAARSLEDSERTWMTLQSSKGCFDKTLVKEGTMLRKKKRRHAEHGGCTRRGSPQFHVHPLSLFLSPSSFLTPSGSRIAWLSLSYPS